MRASASRTFLPRRPAPKQHIETMFDWWQHSPTAHIFDPPRRWRTGTLADSELRWPLGLTTYGARAFLAATPKSVVVEDDNQPRPLRPDAVARTACTHGVQCYSPRSVRY